MQQMGPDGLAFVPIKGFRDTARTIIVYPKGNPSPALEKMLRLIP